MAEILAVTWGEDELAVKRIDSEGVWDNDIKPLRRVPIQRPTRAARFDHPEAGGALGSALRELIHDIEIDVPCWLLIPNQWTLRFVTDPPDLKNPELILNHLRWESAQRIAGDPNDFRISAALLMGGERYFVCLTRSEIISRCTGAAEAVDLELAGIGLEPLHGETYTFEHPLDLRDALPLVAGDAAQVSKSGKRVSPAVVGTFFAVVLIVGWYLISSSGDSGKGTSKKKAAKTVVPEPKPEMTPQQATTPFPEETAAAKPDSVAKPTAEPAVQAQEPVAEVSAPVEKPAPPAGDGSLLGGLFASLDGRGKLVMAALSPVDLKVEVTGVASASQWFATLKRSPGWGGARLAGEYDTQDGPVVSIRIVDPGWKAGEGASSDAWQSIAKSGGLTVKGRLATGKLDAVLAVIDKLWKNSSGISKLYLSPSGSEWRITVQ